MSLCDSKFKFTLHITHKRDMKFIFEAILMLTFYVDFFSKNKKMCLLFNFLDSVRVSMFSVRYHGGGEKK